MVVFWPDKNTKIDIVIPGGNDYDEQVVNTIKEVLEFTKCSYEKTIVNSLPGCPVHYTFVNVTGSPTKMSSLFKALMDLGWDGPARAYIFIHGKKGGKKNGKKAGTKAPAGCEGGNPEGADRAPEYGEGPGVGGDADSCGNPASEPAQQLPEAAAAADGCDQ